MAPDALRPGAWIFARFGHDTEKHRHAVVLSVRDDGCLLISCTTSPGVDLPCIEVAGAELDSNRLSAASYFYAKDIVWVAPERVTPKGLRCTMGLVKRIQSTFREEIARKLQQDMLDFE